MEQIAQLILVAVVFLSLNLLGSSSLSGCVNIVSLQGYCLGLLPFFIHKEGFSGRGILLAVGMAALKGWLVPKVLMHAIREVKIRHEMEPLVGYVPSLLFGTVIVGLSFMLADRLPIPSSVRSGLLVPVSLATMMIGLFMTVSRLKALTQVLGYLVFDHVPTGWTMAGAAMVIASGLYLLHRERRIGRATTSEAIIE